MNGDISIRVLTGNDPALREVVSDLARLRIEIFRDFPYLYDGTLAYEERYISTYLECAESLFVIALDGERVVGVATALPLGEETDEFKQPFIEAGIDPEKVFYCGESVLLAAYRGRGIYRRFLAEREAYARRLGRFDRISMCAVVRPDDHPLRPPGYVSLDAVWDHFGYQPRPDLVASFAWKDLDEDQSSTKPMVFREKML